MSRLTSDEVELRLQFAADHPHYENPGMATMTEYERAFQSWLAEQTEQTEQTE